MNNLEIACFNLVEDILTNRPKNLSGEEEQYGADDSSKIIEIINFQIETVNKYKNVLTDDGYRLLIKIYSGLKELVESKII